MNSGTGMGDSFWMLLGQWTCPVLVPLDTTSSIQLIMCHIVQRYVLSVHVCVLYILLQKRECCIFCKNILAIYELIEIMCIEDCKQYFQVTGGKISTVSCN